jgi:hypothetical protein
MEFIYNYTKCEAHLYGVQVQLYGFVYTFVFVLNTILLKFRNIFMGFWHSHTNVGHISAGIKHNYINRLAHCYDVNIELCELCGTFYGSEE